MEAVSIQVDEERTICGWRLFGRIRRAHSLRTPTLRVGAAGDRPVHPRSEATATTSYASEKVDPTGAKGLIGFMGDQMTCCIVRNVVSSPEAASFRQVTPEVVAFDVGSGAKLTDRNLGKSY